MAKNRICKICKNLFSLGKCVNCNVRRKRWRKPNEQIYCIKCSHRFNNPDQLNPFSVSICSKCCIKKKPDSDMRTICKLIKSA